MPNLTLSIEDTSPLIVYSGSDWTPGSSQNDTEVEQYSQSSYTATDVDGATAFFVFWGTGVQLYGAKRSTHGFYQIGVDAMVYTPINGKANDPGQFQVPLFSASTLQSQAHTVKITNQGKTWVDLDFITFQTPMGHDNEQIIVDTFQDTDPSFSYTPSSAWTSPSNPGMFSGGSGHASSTAGSYFEYTFEGNAVSLFGPVGPSGAPYTVQIDNGLPNNYTTSKPFYRPNMMLYHMNNLGSGKHTVKLAVLPLVISGGEPNFAVDYAEVYTTPSLRGKLSTTLSTGAVAGISIGAFVAFLVFLAFLLFIATLLYRRRMGKPLFHGEKGRVSAQELIQPFSYNVTSSDDTHLAQSQALLQSRQSFIDNATPPTTAHLPLSAGFSTADTSPRPFGLSGAIQNGGQDITIPNTSSGKRRSPHVNSPPQGWRRKNPAVLAPSPANEQSTSNNAFIDDLNPLTAPPMYTQEPSPIRTTFYMPS